MSDPEVESPMRTTDTEYGQEYWDTLDGGAGYHDSTMWSDIAHILHELVGVDREAGRDNAIGLRVLDVGCAFGLLLRHLRKRGYDVRGVDFSHYALDNAPDDILTYLSWFDLTSDEHFLSDWYTPFDVVTCFETLEHIPAESAELAVEHLWNALKPGGLAILTICVTGQPGWDSDPTHVNVVDRSWWEKLFAVKGWQAEQVMLRQLRWFWLFSQHRGVFVLRKPKKLSID